MALPHIDINAGTPPLLWSNVQEAFEKINQNFVSLDAATGGTAVDFSNLFTDVIPATSQTYQLGDQLHRWKSVHTSAWSEIPGSELNGLWAGASHIKGYKDSADRNIIELPIGSTVGGDLIIDPGKTFFKAAQVDNDLRVEANEFSDTLNLNSGTAIQLIVDSSSESIEINNTGVTSLLAGLGILVNSTTGAVTVTNDGVRSLQSTTSLPSGRIAGAGINITATKGDNIKITNTGILDVQEGFGINVENNLSTGIVTVSFDPSATPQTAFTTIAISGDNPVNNLQSDTTADTLTFAQGYGITLSNNPATDTMTIAVNNRIDIVGSVFADNSTLLVDAVAGRIPAEVVQGTFTGSVVGNVSGNVSGTAGVATTVTLVNTESTAAAHYVTFVDSITGNENLRTDTSLNYNPNTNTLTAGTFSGNLTGTADVATAVTLVATDTTNATHYITFVDATTGNENVRTDTDLTYNPSTNSFAAGNLTGNIFTNLIDSADSSQIRVTPLMRFESDVVVENDLTVNNLTTISTLSATNTTVTGRLFVTGNTVSKAVQSEVTNINGATGVVVHNYALGSTFRHTSPAANFTVNITNMNLATGYITQVRLIIVQGSSPRVPTAVQIDGVAQTLLWKDNLPPTGNANKRDVVLFTISNISGSFIVLGELSTYG